MALVAIIAVNQTGTPVLFTQLEVPNGQIPGSGQYELTLSNYVEEILRDTELTSLIQTNNILLTVNTVALTKEQSLAFLDAPTRPVKNNYDQSLAPTPSDDRNAGYSIGSRWITSAGIGYCCTNDAADSAVWERQVRASDSIAVLSDVNTVGAAHGDVLYFNGTNWVHLPAGTDGQLLVTQGPGAAPAWQSSTSAVRRFFSFSFTSSSGQPYIEVTSSTYTTVGYFEWPGTNNVDSPTALSAILQLGGGTDMAIRVYDSTNQLTIAELTGVTGITFTPRNLGTISNLSATDAVWEIQILANGPASKGRIAAFTGVY